PWDRRRPAAHGAGATARRARGRAGVRLPRPHYLVYGVVLPSILATRGQRLLARCTRRLAPERGRTAPAPCGCGLHRCPRAVLHGGGALVGPAVGKSPLVPDPGLLSLPAPRAILARRAHHDSRCCGSAPGGD